jgi:hypothetical protein
LLRFIENLPGEKLTLQMQAGRNGPVDIEIAADGARLHPNADALFALGYLPACELQYDLRIKGEVSPELLDKAGEIFQLYSGWYGYQRAPTVHAQVRAKPAARSERTLLFFSGGVDSCYSLVEARESIHSLVTIVGADLRPENREGAEWVAGLGRQFAEEFDLRPIIIHTAARRWFDRMVTWDHFHGPFMAAVAHMLATEYGRALVASNYGAGGLQMPWGTHPQHEPRYSSAAVSIEHHLPQTRMTKIRRLWAAGMVKDLRVCINPTGGMNCGVCVKCVYLRLALRLLSGDDATAGASFARQDHENFHIINQGSMEFWSGLLVLAEERGDTNLAERIRKVCQGYEIRKARRRRLPMPVFKVLAKRTKRRLRAWSGLLFRVRA